ncbi:MAG: hypothetical protein F6K50_42245 [Moorea sp. SIO3I7]|nr:hypothetical protein [Moorena sp. SIO3I7]
MPIPQVRPKAGEPGHWKARLKTLNIIAHLSNAQNLALRNLGMNRSRVGILPAPRDQGTGKMPIPQIGTSKMPIPQIETGKMPVPQIGTSKMPILQNY